MTGNIVVAKRKFRKYWEVEIGAWHKPWNRELVRTFPKEKTIKDLAWAEQYRQSMK